MRRVLVVNLTRFGDLLQTGPTIAGLREEHPDAHVTVVVERNFAAVCDGLPGIDRVWPIDLDALGRTMLRDDLLGAYRTVEALVTALRAERFDLALNYSSSKMSAVLLRLIGVADTRGWTMTSDGHRLISHPWSRLFSASCLQRRQAPFNLVDYYKRVAGVRRGPQALAYRVPAAAHAAVAERLAAAGAAPGVPLVGFQLGASRAVRRWPAARFVAVARLLAERIGARVVLCGGGGDRPVAEEIAAALGPLAIDCCGRTSVDELGALLARCDVLVTGDTGPMHMAVAVGTPVVALFFGPALPFDTGPYAPDHVCLHAEVACAPCDHNVTCLEPFCRDTFAPEAVAEAVVARRAGDWTALAAASVRWPDVAWYRTGFDAEGLFEAVRLGPAAASRAETLRRAYRLFWKAELDGTPPAPLGAALPAEARTLARLAELASEGRAQAARVEALARDAADLAGLETAARRLEELDAALLRFGAMHEPASLLCQVLRFDKENLDGDDVPALAAATRGLHDRLAERAERLATLLQGGRTDAHHA
ncbi:MAG: glycosyltransferase family 9 protein [bacterium]|nr:glycosyltransferase family 9 protein [bacterium]